jgi:hypothetical protein
MARLEVVLNRRVLYLLLIASLTETGMGGRNVGFSSLAYIPLPCQNQGEIHCRVRIAYLFRAFRQAASPKRYAMRTLRRLRGFKCWVYELSLPLSLVPTVLRGNRYRALRAVRRIQARYAFPRRSVGTRKPLLKAAVLGAANGIKPPMRNINYKATICSSGCDTGD